MVEITFTAQAVDDLRRLGPDVVSKVLKKVVLLEQNPEAGYPLGGELTGFRKLVVGRNSWRIVYRVADDKHVEICEVWAVGARADAQVYAEAARRVRGVSRDNVVAWRLAVVIERLGFPRGTADPTPRREPVPDWLAERLIHTAGMPPEEVAALDLEQAVDRWADFRSRPR
ncbi:type II toxin-antitoxin system RelE family toxin [Nocardiopsis sp. LOL_012]|uniref:type II toxin-antitoxin system RelE family toxin n=1 Tax=Nocardiopsis sp. LOL_012 TaxID=3345409 RepID=UPI003A85E1A2